jgi:adenylate cyclase
MKVSVDSPQRLGYLHLMTLGAAVTVALGLLTWLAPTFVVRLDHAALDIQFRLRGERIPGQEVVLVLVDEKSLKAIGRWPWPRDTQARLVDRLLEAKPAVVGLDVIYAERDENGRGREPMTPGGHSSDSPGDGLQPSENDRRFAASLAQAGNVVMAVPMFVRSVEGFETHDYASLLQTEPLPLLQRSEFMLVKQTKTALESHPYEAMATLPPLDHLARQAMGFGHVYRLPDHDGVTRREVLALRYRESYLPSFALEIARLYLGIAKEHTALWLGDGVQLGSRFVDTDQKLRMLINYAGRELRFPWISASDVLERRVPSGMLHGKIVLVGTAALGTYDQLSTPFSANFSGVEKHATVIDNILHHRALTTGLWSGPLDVGLVCLFGLTLAVTLPRIRAWPGTALAVAIWLSYLAAVQTLFVVKELELPTVMPTVAIGSVFIVTTVLNFVLKERQAREIHAMFSSYVSPRIVQELMKSPSKATVGGQRKELTMLFADLVGFTAFSERLPAEAVVEQLNEYLRAMTEVIFRWNGTLDKFVGDAIVVFWGAPLDQPDHAKRAVQCALEMRVRLGQLQAHWQTEGKPILEHGIGINTGVVLVGNIGAEGKKVDYTMIGDHVNLASRLQELTRTLNVPIVLSEYTAAQLQLIDLESPVDPRPRHHAIRVSPLRVVSVKGRREPVAVYSVEYQCGMSLDGAAAG